MGPNDYTMDVLDPIQMALEGYSRRVAQQQADRQLGMEQQRLDMAQEAMMFERQQAEAQRIAQEQAAAQQAAGQQAYIDYLFNPNKTAENTEAVIRANPQLADAVMQTWQGMNEDQKANAKGFGMQFAYALSGGSIDTAKGLLDQRIQAAEASGDKGQAAAFQAMKMRLEAGDVDGVMADTMVTLYGGMSPDEFTKFQATLPGAAAEEPDSVQALRIRAEEAGLKPGSPEYQEFMAQGGAKPGPQTVVNMGGEAEGAFEREIAKGQATMFQTLLTDGSNARANLSRVNRLEGLLSEAPSGIEAALKKAAGEWGIATEGLDTIQAAEALISQLVPVQRPAGSGQMSDKDVELFKASLPRLINQPGGNAKILAAMKGLVQYQIEQAKIAEQVMAGQMTRQEGAKALMAIPSPLADVDAPAQDDEEILDEFFRLKDAGQPIPADLLAKVKAIDAGGQ